MENIEKYFGKGKYRTFINDHGIKLYNKIISETSILNNTNKNNEKFTARLLFYYKYDCNIELIKINDKIMVFNGSDFKETSSNSTIKQWNDIAEQLNSTNKLYTLEETKKSLVNDNLYKKFLGKSKNRTLINYDLILYKSICEHTKNFNEYNKNYNKLSHRILYLVGQLKPICDCGNKNHWSFKNNNLNVICSKCTPKFPSKNWFVLKYPNEHQQKYVEYFSYIKSLKTNSYEWYINKYGIDDGKEKYRKRFENQLLKLNELKLNRYSKISQELFWEIENRISYKKGEVFFQELNNEYFLKIDSKYEYKTNIIFIDFLYNKKIIEYNGKYWHSHENDKIRYDLLINMGYDVLYVTSDEYNRSHKPKEIVDNCINFLTT